MEKEPSIITRMIHCESDLTIQICLVIFYTLFVEFMIIRPVSQIVDYWSHGKPWKQGCLELEKLTFKKEFKLDISDHVANHYWCEYWGWATQHFLGFMLTLPLMLFGIDKYWGYILMRHGVLMEFGWEIGDFIRRYYTRLFTVDGDKVVPNEVLFLITTHHLMTCCLAVPMNMYYPEEPLYAEFMCLMAGAAASAQFLKSWSSTLDVKTEQGLKQMYYSCTMTFAIFIYSRLIHYIWICYKTMVFVYEREAYILLGIMAVSFSLMGFLNAFFIGDGWTRYKKFSKMYSEFQLNKPKKEQ